MTRASFDFGYPWWLNYGHLAIFIVAVGVLALGRALRWSVRPMIALVAIALWSGAAAVVIFSIGLNRVPSLPTERFLPAGAARVLDVGAGTGRSSLMVLLSRPDTTLVALDLFGGSFEQHFGGDHDTAEARLLRNLEAGGVAARASITKADMRQVPFEPETFDAIVSAYAMDHVGRNGARQALGEAHRVVKPGGQFLLVLIENNAWAKFAFGPLLSHGGTFGRTWWRDAATAAGFQIVEEGSQPATLYFLLVRPAVADGRDRRSQSTNPVPRR